eukprot:1920550-Rhodomonas_salina.1
MDGWMDACLDGCLIDGGIDGLMEGWTDGSMQVARLRREEKDYSRWVKQRERDQVPVPCLSTLTSVRCPVGTPSGFCPCRHMPCCGGKCCGFGMDTCVAVCWR